MYVTLDQIVKQTVRKNLLLDQEAQLLLVERIEAVDIAVAVNSATLVSVVV